MDDIQEGYYNTITTNQIISSIKMQMKIETSDEDINLERIVNEGVRHLDSLSIFVKSFCCLTVTNSRAKLPHGYHSLIGLRFKQADSYDAYGNLIPGFGYIGITYVDKAFLSTASLANNDVQSFTNYQINGGCIHFNNEVADDSTIQLAYWGLNVDEDGLFVVYEDYERALVAYGCWKYCLQNHNSYPMNITQTYMNEWKAQKKWIKSNDVRDHFRNNKRDMAATMNAVINAKTWDV